MKQSFSAASVKAVLSILLCTALVCSCREAGAPKGGQWYPDALNPLTYTDIPDNDVIRVGDDYYMVMFIRLFCPTR